MIKKVFLSILSLVILIVLVVIYKDNIFVVKESAKENNIVSIYSDTSYVSFNTNISISVEGISDNKTNIK